jgi:glucose/arabinose dehydrogenase
LLHFAKRLKLKYYTVILIPLFFSGCYFMSSSDGGGETEWNPPRKINPHDIVLPEGYKIEAVAEGFTFPTGITSDDEGNLYLTESGYSYGEVFTTPKLIRIDREGKQTVIAEGENNGPWTSVFYYENYLYVSEGGQLKGGKVLKISPSGEVTTLAENLPGRGDHHTNGAVVNDDYIYFGQGTATNSGVVGEDNYQFGWLPRNPEFHDIPCEDIELTGENYKSANPLEQGSEAVTGAFVSFNQKTSKGQVIKGEVPCSGSIMRVPVNGGGIKLIAWGFRNPFGLAFREGDLYVTDNGYDERGSRPVWGTGDLLWKVEKDKWYGWPDYSGHHELHNVKPVIANHPNKPPDPAAHLGVHSSSNGLDFSSSEEFGYKGEAFIAQFGDQAPVVGKVLNPVGFKVVRVNTETSVITDFAVNKGKVNGPASYLEHGGLERPVAVRFSPNGKEMYIVDFGILLMSDKGAAPKEKTGVVWKVSKDE